MFIYIICPVRNVTLEQQEEIDQYATHLEQQGHTVHNPKYAVDQSDPTGMEICKCHLMAMAKADRVDIFWDATSKGSHFDVGMAFALRKPLRLCKAYQADSSEKSYHKVIWEVENNGYGKETRPPNE